MPLELTPETGSIVLPSYLTVAEADALAVEVPGVMVANWTSASESDKAKALGLASADLDAAMPYQGQRYDPAQALEFPRIAFGGSLLAAPGASTGTVWDLDAAGVAVVPAAVKLACLWQAQSILANDRESRIAAAHDGLASQAVGSASESYKLTGAAPVLSVRAHRLMLRYRLRQGEML